MRERTDRVEPSGTTGPADAPKEDTHMSHGSTVPGWFTYKSTPTVSEVARDIDFAIDVTEPREVLLKRFEDILTAWRATWR
jgi:hypothetical protein